MHLFDGNAGTYMRVHPSGGWELGAEGGIVYATSDREGVCRATNAVVFRVRSALIEGLNR